MRRRWPAIVLVAGVLAVSAVVLVRYVIPLSERQFDKDPEAVRARIAARFDDAEPGQRVGVLRDLTDFAWDRAYVFGEGTSVEQIRQVVWTPPAEDGWRVPHRSTLVAFEIMTVPMHFVLLSDVRFTSQGRKAWGPHAVLVAPETFRGDEPRAAYLIELVDPGPPTATTTAPSATPATTPPTPAR